MPDATNQNAVSAPAADCQAAVFAFLGEAASHGAKAPVKRIDTHGAIVFLVDGDVYKVKRAVRFPFMDFSTLEKRRIACEAEIEVNRANAPMLYLGVVPIVRADNRLAIGGAGDVVEWAVHMRRFDEDQTLDRLASRGELSLDMIADLAKVIEASHRRAPVRTDFDFAEALARFVEQNDVAFADEPDFFDLARSANLTLDARAARSAARSTLRRRNSEGHVRRCHGDLHLGNIAMIAGEPTLFDAIEFDDSIATCDVLYDLAYALMDLEERGLRAASNLLLNRWLWARDVEDDFGALAALPLFLSLRAAIRAKVVAAGTAHLHGEANAAARRHVEKYFNLAEQFLKSTKPTLVAIGGLSGTGKSRLSVELAPGFGRAPGAVWLRSDIERKLMFQTPETASAPQAAYAPDVTNEVYARLRRRAALALAAGASVVVDAVHARPGERDAIEQAARDCGARFFGIWLEASADLRDQRVAARVNDASDAGVEIARQQSSYDLGPMRWRRVDASRDSAAIAGEALGLL